MDTAAAWDPLRQKAPPLWQVRSAPGQAGLTHLRPRRPRLAPGPRHHSRAGPETAGSHRGLCLCAQALQFTLPGRPWGGPASPFTKIRPGAPTTSSGSPCGVSSPPGSRACLASPLGSQEAAQALCPPPSPTAGTSTAFCFSFCDAASVGATRMGPGPERGLVRKGGKVSGE